MWINKNLNMHQIRSECYKLLMRSIYRDKVKSTIHLRYGNMGCQSFKQGIHNYKDFCIKINILKGSY